MLIGICGKAGSGKDTVASFLEKDHGFVSISLADPMKRFLQAVLDFSDDQLWGPSEKRNEPDKRYPRPCVDCLETESRFVEACPTCRGLGRTFLSPREALQELGTAWGRKRYADVWVECLLRTMCELQTGGCYYSKYTGVLVDSSVIRAKIDVVVPDVRFRNEVEAIRKVGGYVWRVERPGAGLKGATGAHISETGQESIPEELFSWVIDNSGTLDDLCLTVCSARHMPFVL